MKYFDLSNSKVPYDESLCTETDRLSIFDGNGHEYRISTNSKGDLMIMAADGDVCIKPEYSNQILINTI